MIKEYPYLQDTQFLDKIYHQHNRTTYANITILDWKEEPITEVSSRIISASISENGDSSVRRTANLTVKIYDNNELYENIDSLFSINKKIFLETGLNNGFAHQGYYSDYPVIWFPKGVYLITSCSLSRTVSDISISLQLQDKMCLLNGYAGGTIPASTNFESYDTLGPDGDLHTELIRINDMIPEIVNHFGGEELTKIFVNDVDSQIKQVMKWTGSNPLYIYQNLLNANNSLMTTLSSDSVSGITDPNEYKIRKIIAGYDAGYIYTDFTFPGELAAGAGDTVTTVLDKIKETLGNYEYFYDVFGNFFFQEIKNYVNVSEATKTLENHAGNEDYWDYTFNKVLNGTCYSFDNSELVVSYSNSPQFDMIKNDFIVWGTREDNGVKYPCRYHLAIDKRPILTEDWVIKVPVRKDNGQVEEDARVIFDTSMVDKIRRCYICSGIYDSYANLMENAPQVVGNYYYVSGDGVYTWVADKQNYQALLDDYNSRKNNITSTTDSKANEYKPEAGFLRMPLATFKSSWTLHPTTNWRNVLYFQGLLAAKNGLDQNYYFAELYNEWPKVYDIENDKWIDGVLDSPTSLDFWLDFIDNDATLSAFGVDVIGRRSYAKTDSNCNCVFEPTIPDIIILSAGDAEEIINARIKQMHDLGLAVTQVDPSIYNALATGGTYNSCYEHIRQILSDYTNYNNSITISCLPIFHLEPNTMIDVNDEASGIKGRFLINSISYSLGADSQMTISAKKVVEKI